MVETLQIDNPKSPRNIDQILIYVLLMLSDSLRKTKNKETKQIGDSHQQYIVQI